MQNKTNIIILVCLVLLLASCSKDPKEMMASYLQKYEKLSEYSIIYKSNLANIIEPTWFNVKVSTFKKNDYETDVAEFETDYGTEAVSLYIVDGEIVTCGKSNLGGEECIDGIEGLGEYKQSNDYAYLFTRIDIKDSAVTYEGNLKLIGRKCDRFSVQIKNLGRFLDIYNSNYLFFEGTSLYENIPATLDVCLDKDTGLPLSSQLYTITKSELDNKETNSTVLSYAATSFSDKVNDSAFALPENTCYAIKSKEQCQSSNLDCQWDKEMCESYRQYYPSSCAMEAGFHCSDYRVDNQGTGGNGKITVILQNSLGLDVDHVTVKAENCGTTDFPISMLNGEETTFTVNCDRPLTISRYDGQLNISYRIKDTGGEYTNKGQLSVKLER